MQFSDARNTLKTLLRALDGAERTEREQPDRVIISNPVTVDIYALASIPGAHQIAAYPSRAKPESRAVWYKTADEIIYDLHGLVNAMVKLTGGKFRPTHMRMPLEVYNIASTRRMGDGSNQTVLSFFMATSPYVKSVEPAYQLDFMNSEHWNPGGPAVARVIAYQDNPGKFVEVNGVLLPCPDSVAYMDGLSDAASSLR